VYLGDGGGGGSGACRVVVGGGSGVGVVEGEAARESPTKPYVAPKPSRKKQPISASTSRRRGAWHLPMVDRSIEFSLSAGASPPGLLSASTVAGNSFGTRRSPTMKFGAPQLFRRAARCPPEASLSQRVRRPTRLAFVLRLGNRRARIGV
jgi:hypothetical protein